MSAPKLCPMTFNAPIHSPVPYDCQQEKCAWWIGASLKNLAESFAAENRGDDPMGPLRGHCAILDIGRAT